MLTNISEERRVKQALNKRRPTIMQLEYSVRLALPPVVIKYLVIPSFEFKRRIYFII